MTKILRISHSAVVDQWRERERLLRTQHGYDLELVCAPKWREGTAMVEAAPATAELPVTPVTTHGRVHPILFWYDVRELARVIRRVQPDLIDVSEEPYSLAAVSIRAAARLAGSSAPMVIFTAQNIIKRYPLPFRHWEQAMYRRVAAAYPCTEEAGAVLRAKGFRGEILAIPLGVPQPSESPQTNGGTKVGFVGRLTPEKGPQLVLQAIAALRGEREVQLEFVGDGPLNPILRGAADRLGLNGSVTFSGPLPPEQVWQKTASFDVLVVASMATASWKEQFCRAAVEALAIGTPVLSSSSGSLPNVLGSAAEYFAEGDVGDLIAQLRRMLDDPERRAELIREGQRLVGERYTWQRVAERFDALYRGVLGSTPAV